MADLREYEGRPPAWCPGCGNFGILKAFNEAVAGLGLAPHRLIVVSGIGQAGKFPHYTRCNTFNGLHGRGLPVATGIRLAGGPPPVIAVAGDGDAYGEGGNHLIHEIRRNIDVKMFVHDNQVYGLTKGQTSPTSMAGMKTKAQPEGSQSQPLNPLALAVSLDCSFVARGYAGDQEHLSEMIRQAIGHTGFALLDILQPCVTFNHLNTYQWFAKRVYRLDASYDPSDRAGAFAKALEFGDAIPLGVIYRSDRPPFRGLAEGHAAAGPSFDPGLLAGIMKEFY
jgi:2-oxoglutarate ferredoxin oxidoreductase subunit beta